VALSQLAAALRLVGLVALSLSLLVLATLVLVEA
jgi:hypothetical protein